MGGFAAGRRRSPASPALKHDGWPVSPLLPSLPLQPLLRSRRREHLTTRCVSLPIHGHRFYRSPISTSADHTLHPLPLSLSTTPPPLRVERRSPISYYTVCDHGQYECLQFYYGRHYEFPYQEEEEPLARSTTSNQGRKDPFQPPTDQLLDQTIFRHSPSHRFRRFAAVLVIAGSRL